MRNLMSCFERHGFISFLSIFASLSPVKRLRVRNWSCNVTLGNLSLSGSQGFPKQALVFTCLLYKPFKNTVRKGEIACNEQFLLFPQCF